MAVGASYEGYASREAPVGHGGGFQLVSMRLRTRARVGNPYFSSYLDFGGAFASNAENYSYIAAPEAYLRWTSEPSPMDEATSGFTGRARAPGLSLLLGRAKETWSRLDDQWSLGLWQPLFRYDWVRPEAQGLSGAFISMETANARLVLFGSPIFIPEQGPPFELVDGRFSSPSPWFSGPPRDVILFGHRDELRYSVQTPSVGSVVSHVSAGAMAQLGDPSQDGLWAQASYAYKPRNQLTTPFRALLTPGPTATIFPVVAYHHLVGGDIGANAGPLSAWISNLYEIPIDTDMAPAVTYQRLRPMFAVSPTVEARLPFASRWRPRVTASYLRRFGDEPEDVNSLPTGNGSAFGPRFPYYDAGSISARATTQLARGRVLDMGVKFTQEFLEDGMILSADVRFQPAPAWTLSAGADVIASGRPDSDSSTMIARDRGNDRGFLGVAYAF